jgi:nucleoside-diphosphate-sugar epimerase
MAKIVVTGASGQIGPRLCDDLARDNEVVRVDLKGADVNLDIGDFAAVEKALAGVETVIHLAADSSVSAPWESTFHVNIGGTYNIFEGARRQGCKRVIFASSNHAVGMYEIDNKPQIYEGTTGILVRNDSELRPDGFYGVSKIFGEALGRYYSDVYGMQVCCVRIGSVLGVDDPKHPSLAQGAAWLNLTVEQKYKRYAATWMSQRDLARLMRAVISRDVPFSIIYGVGDNLTRFWDLEPGRAVYGWWPIDGVKE